MITQVLIQKQSVLFDVLGKTSAKDKNKLEILKDRGWNITDEFGHHVLEGCHGYLLLQCISGPVDAGDHDVVICKVTEYLQNANSDSNLLYTDFLRERGLL